MLSDRFSLEAVNCPFAYFEIDPSLNFEIMLETVANPSLNIAFFLQFVLYIVYR